ncbi:hypothetical protein CF326_g9146 [Tilletia indica]|nr:hypothetical protein CF326_g9146 [Tilletia indica]
MQGSRQTPASPSHPDVLGVRALPNNTNTSPASSSRPLGPTDAASITPFVSANPNPPLALGANPRRGRPIHLDAFYGEALPPMPGPSAPRRPSERHLREIEGGDEEATPPPPYRSPIHADGDSSDDSDAFEITGVKTAPPPEPSPPPTAGKGKKRASTPGPSPAPTQGKGKKRPSSSARSPQGKGKKRALSPAPSSPSSQEEGVKRVRSTQKAGPTKGYTKPTAPARKSPRHSKPATATDRPSVPDFSTMNFGPVRRAPRLIPRDWNPPVAIGSSQDAGPSRALHSRRSRSTPFSGSPSEDEDEEGEQEGREEEEQEVEEGEGAVTDEERGGEGTPPVDEVAFANPQPPATPITATIFQPAEQRRVVSMAERGKSLFVTGPAGSGKTYALVMIKKLLLDKHGTKMGRVATVAATNNAALCCDGETYHSYFGFSPNDIDLDTVYQRTSRNRVKLLSLQVLLIDEGALSTTPGSLATSGRGLT